MESNRQQKIARQIQKDISDIFLKEASGVIRGTMVSVTKVRVSPDLGFARIFISVFPFDKNQEILRKLTDNISLVRKALGNRVRSQLRIVPEIVFSVDDSLEYIENIDKLLKE